MCARFYVLMEYTEESENSYFLHYNVKSPDPFISSEIKINPKWKGNDLHVFL